VAGVPAKVTTKYLQSVGFKSTNDRPIIGVLKALGFLDSSGVPTEVWKSYRNADKAKSVLASSVREAYPGLFETYPDADRKDSEALLNYFRSKTNLGGVALTQMVRTFQTLCEFGDFTKGATVKVASKSKSKSDDVEVLSRAMRPPEKEGTSQTLTLNLNIQLQIPATEDATIYEKFFTAMRKHLLS